MLHSCGRTSNTLFHIFIRRNLTLEGITEFGMAELYSSPIVNTARKREVTCWSSSMASTLFKSVSISSSVDCPKWPTSLYALGSSVRWDTRLSPIDSWEDILLQSAAETAQTKNRGFRRGTVVKTFGRLYNEFLPTKRSIVQENRVQRAHGVPTRQGARPGGRARPPLSWKPHVLLGLLLISLFS